MRVGLLVKVHYVHTHIYELEVSTLFPFMKPYLKIFFLYNVKVIEKELHLKQSESSKLLSGGDTSRAGTPGPPRVELFLVS